MPKKTFRNPAEALLAMEEEPTAQAPEVQATAAPEKKAKAAIKSEHLTFVATPEIMQDLTDLVNCRIFAGKKVDAAIAGKRARKPSASLILNEALTEYLGKPEVRAELAEYRAKFQ